MSFIETIKVVVDVATEKATSALGDVKTKVSEAEGTFGKLKAGAGGVFDTLKSAGPLAVAGVGAAIGGFVVKGISDFENLALSAESFSTAAGTSVSDASRWIEVSDDLGVSADAVQGAMGRLNREAADGKLAQFGITADNANDRLIQTLQYLQSIPDEAARSKASFELLGKGSAAIAPLVASAGELRDRLNEVSGAKIIDEGDVKDAKAFRDDMDRVTDAIDNLVLSAGKIALPFADVIAELAGPVAELIGKLSDLRAEAQAKADDSGSSWTDKLTGFLTQTGPEAADFWLNKIDEVTGGTGDRFGKTGEAAAKLGDVIEQNGEKFIILGNETKRVTGYTDEQIASLKAQALAAGDSANATGDSTEAQREAEQAAKDLAAAIDKVYDASSKNTLSQLDAQSAVIQTNMKLQEYGKTLGDTSLTADQQTLALNDMETQLIQTSLKVADAQTAQQTFGSEQDKTSAKLGIQIQNLQAVQSTLDPSSALYQAISGYIAHLKEIQTNVNTTVDANTDPAEAAVAAFIRSVAEHPAYIDVVGRLSDQGQARASGGPVKAGQSYVVGDTYDPEVFVPDQDGRIVHANGSGGGGMVVYNQQFNVKQSLSPSEVTSLQRTWQRRNGRLDLF